MATTDQPAPAEDQPRPQDASPARAAESGAEEPDRKAGGGEPAGEEIDVRSVELGEIPERDPGERDADVGGNLGMLLDIPMPVSVEVGRGKVLLEEVLQIAPGFVLRLDKKVGDPVDLMINGKRVAEGEVVAVDEQLGIRITRVVGGVPPVK